MRALPLALLLLTLTACDTVGTDAVIVRYTGPAITEADALVPNPPLGTAGWEGLVFLGRTGTSVSVDRQTLCGDECSQTLRFTFQDMPPVDSDALPEAARGVIEIVSGTPDGYETQEVGIGRVEIQDWGPEVYSGVVYPAGPFAPNVDPPPPTVFWADDLSFAVE